MFVGLALLMSLTVSGATPAVGPDPCQANAESPRTIRGSVRFTIRWAHGLRATAACALRQWHVGPAIKAHPPTALPKSPDCDDAQEEEPTESVPPPYSILWDPEEESPLLVGFSLRECEDSLDTQLLGGDPALAHAAPPAFSRRSPLSQYFDNHTLAALTVPLAVEHPLPRS